MRLNADQKQQRREILQELYDQGLGWSNSAFGVLKIRSRLGWQDGTEIYSRTSNGKTSILILLRTG